MILQRDIKIAIGIDRERIARSRAVIWTAFCTSIERLRRRLLPNHVIKILQWRLDDWFAPDLLSSLVKSLRLVFEGTHPSCRSMGATSIVEAFDVVEHVENEPPVEWHIGAD